MAHMLYMNVMHVMHLVALHVSMPILVHRRLMLSRRVCNRGLQELLAGVLASLGVHEQGNNESVKTQNFGENENQDHSDEQPGLLGSSSYTSVTDNTDGETGSHTGKTDGKTSAELDEVGEERRLLLQAVGDEDGHNQTVDTDNTRHDNGDNVLDDQVRAEDTHG